MAVTRGPLFSLEASGSIASTLTFARWKGRPYVRELVTPANPNTIGQQAARAIMRFGSQQFSSLTAGDQALWAALARAQSLTNIDVWVKDGGVRRLNDLGFRTTPTGSGGTANGAPLTPVATGQRGQVVLTWVNSVTGTILSTGVHRGLTGFTVNGSNLVRLTPIGTLTATITRLVPGTYFFKIRHYNAQGTPGTASTEVSAVVT